MTSPRAPYSGVALAREPVRKDPPWPPLIKGGKGKGPSLIKGGKGKGPSLIKGGKGKGASLAEGGEVREVPPHQARESIDREPLRFPPLIRGGQGGSISQPRGEACLPAGRLVLLLIAVAIGGASSRPAWAQQPVRKDQGQAADVFDEQTENPPGEKPDESRKAPAVSDRDSIGFTQQNVAAQMNELEERMFRLSEALRSLEPENASRLKLALKFSREESILQQMKATQDLLKQAQLSQAETEVRELLAKLEHLRNLLLAEDLDFQMKLARLRQMRETLGQLERIIKEERRELAWSRSADEQQTELMRLRSRRTDLDAIVRDQKALIGATRAPSQNGNDAAKSKPAQAANRARAAGIQKKAAGLAGDPLFAGLQPPYLKQADPHLADAVNLLATTEGTAAVAALERALERLQKELDRLADRIGKSEQAVALSEFQRFEQDQARNRSATHTLAVISARLGDKGVALQKDLIRAGGSMQAAEHELEKAAAKPAAEDQLAALQHLVKSRDELARAVESLLVQLRSELQTRILAELSEMHEMQVAIRETTQAQARRVAQHSRTALILVVGLAPKEAELGDRTEQLQALAEETEFGIALPTSLRVLTRAMRKVQEWLEVGDASTRTIALEKRIEEDLLALAEAMRRLPPTTAPPAGAPLPSDPRGRERELNRRIAELKMIRLIQSRLNDDTLEVNRGRPKTPIVTPALRREIQGLKSAQEEIRDSLAKLSGRFEPPEVPDVNVTRGQVDR